MGYILRDDVLIKRPIIFLCGPYFKKGNKSDRRYLLRKCFRKHYRDGVLPLIIDDFLTEDNIKDSNVNIQLLEEIFAAISCKTYIFLDTLSAASELGLFMNHAFTNSVVAYVPKESDILNKSNVGYFVKDVILKMNSEQAKCIEYRPAITRSVISSDYAVEHYGFIADIVPENIEKEIASDIIFKDKKEKSLYTEENEQYPDDDFHIFYKTRDGKTILHISIGMLFDVVMSLMYELNQSKLVTNKEATIADFNVDAIQRITKEVFLNYLIKKGIHCGKEIELYTKLSYSFDTIVYHMVTFCYIYHCYSTYRGLRLVDKHMDTILDTCEEINGNNPLQVFGISEEDYLLVESCASNQQKFYTSFTITKGKKKRELVKYVDTEKGHAMRKIHEKMMSSLREKYTSSELSFAYKKGGSIKKCVELHKNNDAYIKYDISKFFNSIKFEILIEKIKRVFNIDSIYDTITKKIVASFYFEKKLPLGLVISPLLSDIYMLDFDKKITEFCSLRNCIYTRYADDILISKKTIFTESDYKEINQKVEMLLCNLKLKINSKKTRQIFLRKDGQHIKYIGINIVHFDAGNKLSVGRKYVYAVVNEYYQYLEDLQMLKDNNCDGERKRLFYQERIIAGKLAFIQSIEGADGWKRIRARFGKNAFLCENNRLSLDNLKGKDF